MYVTCTVSVGTANEHCSSLVCIRVCVCVCDAVPGVNDTAAHPNKGEWCLGTLGRHS